MDLLDITNLLYLLEITEIFKPKFARNCTPDVNYCDNGKDIPKGLITELLPRTNAITETYALSHNY